MTTANLGLSSTSEASGSAVSFLEWRLLQDGNSGSSNMGRIDSWAGQVSASIINISASTVGLSASAIELSGSVVILNRQMIEASASIVAISGSSPFSTATYATSKQVTSGSSSTALVSASALAHSDYGKRTVVVPLNTSASLTTADVNYVRIPAIINGWQLSSAQACCTGSSLSGSPVFTVSRISASAAQETAVSLLTTNIMIDEGEYDSSTSGTPSVPNTSGCKVITGDKIKVGSSTSGSNVTYAEVSLTFHNLTGA